MSQSQPKKNPPEKKITPVPNGVSAVIWLNQVDSDNGPPRVFRSITIETRRYFDRKANEWKSSPSISPTDLPILVYALEQARDYVFSEPLPGQGSAAAREPGDDEDVPY